MGMSESGLQGSVQSSQRSTYRKGTSLLDKGNKGASARAAVNRKKL